MTFHAGPMQIIGGEKNNLSASLDYDDNPDDAHLVLLFTPDTTNTDDHYHIDLTQDQGWKLLGWLEENLQ